MSIFGYFQTPVEKDQPQPPLYRCVHIREGSRVITIVYTHNEETRTITYGATIFNPYPEKHPCLWNRKDHLATAIGRFQKSPVIVENFQPQGRFRKELRKLLPINGVKGVRL